MQNVPFRATGKAMPIVTRITLPKSGILLTISVRAGRLVMFGRGGRAS